MWERQKEPLAAPPKPAPSPSPMTMPTPPATAPIANQAPRGTEKPTHVGKSVVLKGTLTGAEDLYIDGKIEGTVDVPKNSVTVGLNGQVQADVTAREVIILGKLSGNVTATDRVEIRAQGALTGDVTAARISIEDGAFFKGGIDIQKGSSAKANVG